MSEQLEENVEFDKGARHRVELAHYSGIKGVEAKTESREITW